jgi:hypothetical protein
MSAKDKLLLNGLRRAVRLAMIRHKQTGSPVCAWRDGRIVWIPPDEIPTDQAEEI